jgi:hypothetical protein
MASKSQRHARRLKRKNIAAQAPGPVDPHLLSVLKSMGGMGSKMLHLSKSEDRAAASAEQLAAAVDALAEEMEGHNRFQVCEGARQSCLPWTVAGVMRPDTDGGAAIAELLTLIAFAGGFRPTPGRGRCPRSSNVGASQ